MVAQHTPTPLQSAARSRAGRLRRLPALFSAVIALTLTLTAFTSVAAAHPRACAHAHTSIAAASRSQMRAAVVCLINQQRSARGLPMLAANRQLNRSAQGWTNDMVSHQDFTHGADFASRITATGFDWSNVGENIAGGFRTPAAVVRAWMASTGHCQNILSPVYREVGTGVNGGSSMGGDALGTWTQDFGLVMGQHAASANFGPAEGCPYK